MKRLLFFLLLIACPLSTLLAQPYGSAQGWCEQGGQTIKVLGYQSATTTPVQRSYPSCTVTVSLTGQLAVQSAVYQSGGSITGSAGQTCTATFTGGTGGTGTVALTGNNVIAAGGAFTINSGGTGFLAAPTTAALSNGTALCSGTAAVNAHMVAAPATLFYNTNGTVLANPFTAAANGYWFFYADNGIYDVQFSGGGLTAPVVAGSISIGGTGGGVGGTAVYPSGDATGATDLANIQTAVNRLPANGGTVVLMDTGPFYLPASGGVQIGNGSATAASTVNGINVTCNGTGPSWGGAAGAEGGACVVNSLADSPAFYIHGPMTGWSVDNIRINVLSTNSAARCLRVESALWGHFINSACSLDNVSTSQGGIDITTNANDGSAPGSTYQTGYSNSMHNEYQNANVYMGANATGAFAFRLHSGVKVATNTCFEKFGNVTIQGLRADQKHLWLGYTDSDKFEGIHEISYGIGLYMDYVGEFSGTYGPSDVSLFSLEPSGAITWANNGAPATGIVPNSVYHFGQVNGNRPPDLLGLNFFTHNTMIFNNTYNVGQPAIGFIPTAGMMTVGAVTNRTGGTVANGPFTRWMGITSTGGSFVTQPGGIENIINSTSGITCYAYANTPVNTPLLRGCSNGSTAIGATWTQPPAGTTLIANDLAGASKLVVKEGITQGHTTQLGFQDKYGNPSGAVIRYSDIREFGAYCDDSHDDTAALNLAIVNASATGATVYIPWTTTGCLISGKITIPSTTFGMVPLKIYGTTAGFTLGGNIHQLPGASTLDMRYQGTITPHCYGNPSVIAGHDACWTEAKIVTFGSGELEIEGVEFVDRSGTTNETPFIYTTFTPLYIHNCRFIGTVTRSNPNPPFTLSSRQDAIVLGGTIWQQQASQNPNVIFQGYGTSIVGNFFEHMQRAVYGRAAANSMNITQNLVSFLGGGYAAIEFDGSNIFPNGQTGQSPAWSADCTYGSSHLAGASNCVGTQGNYGNWIAGNYMEAIGYNYGIKLTMASQMTVVGNSIPDVDNHTLGDVYLDPQSTSNMVLPGTYNPNIFVALVSGADSGTTIHFSAGDITALKNYYYSPQTTTGVPVIINNGGVVYYTSIASVGTTTVVLHDPVITTCTPTCTVVQFGPTYGYLTDMGYSNIYLSATDNDSFSFSRFMPTADLERATAVLTQHESGVMFHCDNCQPGTAPCASGGNGAIAEYNARTVRWECGGATGGGTGTVTTFSPAAANYMTKFHSATEITNATINVDYWAPWADLLYPPAGSGGLNEPVIGFTTTGQIMLVGGNNGSGTTTGAYAQFLGNTAGNVGSTPEGGALIKLDTTSGPTSFDIYTPGGKVAKIDSKGTVSHEGLIDIGGQFNTSGCSISGWTGGSTVGKFATTSTSCTLVITMGNGTITAAPHGWDCNIRDLNIASASAVLKQTSSNTTTATFSLTGISSGDGISFSCVGY